jgi:hypothetical protein
VERASFRQQLRRRPRAPFHPVPLGALPPRAALRAFLL